MVKDISKPQKGLVLFCPVCRTEVCVVNGSRGRLNMRCCNREMLVKQVLLAYYLCTKCGSEVMVLFDGGGKTEPICCNIKMKHVKLKNTTSTQ